MSTYTQRSFAAGEIAPALYPRVDTSRYATGLRQCVNSVVLRHGGTANRAGTQWVCEVKDSSKRVRLIPFVFNNDQALVIEFGDQYIRFHLDGFPVTETAKNITGITQANPGVVTSNSHGFENGDWVYITGISGMTQANGRFYVVAGKTANTFELTDVDGNNVNTSGFTAYSSGGTAARVYEIASTYLEAELADIQFTQSADVVTIAHSEHAPATLSRTSNTDWTLADVEFSSGGAAPKASASAGAGSTTHRYVITYIEKETLREIGVGDQPVGTVIPPGRETTRTITNGTAANPVVFTTSTAHGYAVGDEVYLFKLLAWANNSLPAGYYTVSAVGSSTTFSIAQNTTGFGAWTGLLGNAQANRRYVTVHSAPARSSLSVSNPVTLTWTDNGDAKEYNIYLESNGIFGYLGTAAAVGSASTVTFDDVGLTADLTDTLPVEREIFDAADKYPGVIGFFQQRQAYGRSNDETEQVWLSKTGDYDAFNYHSPASDDDSIAFTIAGRQVNEVRHLLDLGNLVILTSAGEWAALGDANGVLTPSGINPKQYGYHGASKISPIVVGNNALYVQARGNIIRDLAFDYAIDGYKGNDLTVFSSHLFEGRTVSDWAFQQAPNSIVWVVLETGEVRALTYVKDQDIIGWSQHDFGGIVENVCVIPEGDEDALYLVVKRTVDGVTRRYIERMESRYVDSENIIGKAFMDSSLTYDGRNTGSTTMTISGGTTWDAHETMTVTASASYFLTTDVGNEIHFTDSDGSVLFRFTIEARSSATVVTGQVDRLVPVTSRSAATTSWTKAVDEVTGLFHLEGEEVSVFADGYVVASPNNPAYGEPLVVADGTLSLTSCYGVIHVGLPYISDLETLDIDTADGETLADKHKMVGKVTLHLEKSRGIWVGPKPPTDDATDALENLTEAKIRDTEGYNEANDLFTGRLSVAIRPEWNSNGRVFIRQVDPIPISVLAVSPAGMYPISRGG